MERWNFEVLASGCGGDDYAPEVGDHREKFFFDFLFRVDQQLLSDGATRHRWCDRATDDTSSIKLLLLLLAELADGDLGSFRCKHKGGMLLRDNGRWRSPPNHDGLAFNSRVTCDNGLRLDKQVE